MADTLNADVDERLVLALLRQNYADRLGAELEENAHLRAALGQVMSERDELQAKLAALQAAAGV